MTVGDLHPPTNGRAGGKNRPVEADASPVEVDSSPVEVDAGPAETDASPVEADVSSAEAFLSLDHSLVGKWNNRNDRTASTAAGVGLSTAEGRSLNGRE
ncbi:MAG TPA: hypothetical protein VH988_31125 [Thermoanaerobaculia bacterium]|jgi:hypothetical protein|nr:hypothetical protein [Thermoanaerobaculia bacterium]